MLRQSRLEDVFYEDVVSIERCFISSSFFKLWNMASCFKSKSCPPFLHGASCQAHFEAVVAGSFYLRRAG